MDIVGISDVQIVGRAAAVGVDQARRVKLLHHVHHSSGVELRNAVVLVEHCPHEDGRGVVPARTNTHEHRVG